jgi:hypothetical protein
MPVYIVDNDITFRYNPELRNTDSSGNVQYCVPNKVRGDDMSSISVWTDYDSYNELAVTGYFAVDYKGFWQKTAIPSNVANGTSKVITLPVDSTATIYRLGSLKSGQSVYVTNANLTQIISNTSITTGSNGQASFAIPNGTQFRFLVQDTDGTQTYTNTLTAPVSTTIRMVAQNTPTLTSPANNASFDISTVMNFSWASVSGAAQYAWFYRHSSSTEYTGYLTSTNSFNGVQFNGTGTWYWIVQAFDSAGNLIAQSQARSFILTNSQSQSAIQSQNSLLSNLGVTPSAIPPVNAIEANGQPVTNIAELAIQIQAAEAKKFARAQKNQLESEPVLPLGKFESDDVETFITDDEIGAENNIEDDDNETNEDYLDFEWLYDLYFGSGGYDQ